MTATLGYTLVMLAGALVVGWLLGRFTGKAAAATRDLAAQIESLRKDGEHAAAELAAAKGLLERSRVEHEQYRDRVSEHFVGASDRFRDLSLQYRSLFDHLSESARDLCGEGFTPLEGDLAAGALPSRAGGAAPEAAPGRDEGPVAKRAETAA
jgi:uncharacterized membrane-anchored protein YhcB (DUF1043 family)